jgi:hypothetical protein
MSRAPSRPHSTPMCSGTIGEQQIQFGTHLLLLRVGNAAEAYVLAAERTRTEVPRARETTAAEAGDVHQRLAPATGGRLIWSLASTLISVRPRSALASGVHNLPIAGADQSVIRGGERPTKPAGRAPARGCRRRSRLPTQGSPRSRVMQGSSARAAAAPCFLRPSAKRRPDGAQLTSRR